MGRVARGETPSPQPSPAKAKQALRFGGEGAQQRKRISARR